MATTVTQDRDFIAAVISTSLLEEAIKWIANNLEPEDVFGNDRMKEWSECAGPLSENIQGAVT